MKSVIRSAFDPVPRPLSQGAQLLVVGFLIVGIAISVFEYVDSSARTLAGGEDKRPARVETTEGAQPAATDFGARPRLVRATLRTQADSAGTIERTGTTLAPSEPSAAPMSVQPPEGG